MWHVCLWHGKLSRGRQADTRWTPPPYPDDPGPTPDAVFLSSRGHAHYHGRVTPRTLSGELQPACDEVVEEALDDTPG